MLIPLVLIPLTGTFLVLDFTGLDTFKVLHLVCEVHLHDSSGFHLAWSISSSFQLSTYLSLTCTNFSSPRVLTCHLSWLLLASISTYLTPTHFNIHLREPLPDSTLAHFSVYLPQLAFTWKVPASSTMAGKSTSKPTTAPRRATLIIAPIPAPPPGLTTGETERWNRLHHCKLSVVSPFE